jgi:lysozyme
MATTQGIDISNYQGDIGPLPANIAFVIIKVTEGTTYVNPYWQQQRDQVRSQGKLPLYYHFLDDVTNAVAEADHAAAVLGDSWQAGEGAAVDWEVGAYSAVVDAGVADFIKEFRDKTTVLDMLYSNNARIVAGPWTQTRATGAGLWDAAWGGNVPDGTPWPFVAIWQSSDSGKVSGVTGDVDTDVAMMDEAHLKLYGWKVPSPAPAAATPPPPTPPAPEPTPAPTPPVSTTTGGQGKAIDIVVTTTPPAPQTVTYTVPPTANSTTTVVTPTLTPQPVAVVTKLSLWQRFVNLIKWIFS